MSYMRTLKRGVLAAQGKLPEKKKMKIGDHVMVPRTDGSQSEGEVIELYTTHARVKFPIGDTFRGKPTLEKLKALYGYKTIRLSELKLIEE